jgi:hypothetical protein
MICGQGCQHSIPPQQTRVVDHTLFAALVTVVFVAKSRSGCPITASTRISSTYPSRIAQWIYSTLRAGFFALFPISHRLRITWDKCPRASHLPVSESGLPGMHNAHFIQILPTLGLFVIHRNQLHQVPGEKVLAEFDLRMLMREVFDIRGRLTRVPCLPWDEGGRGDVETEQLSVDRVDNGGDEGRHDRARCVECGGVGGVEIYELAKVGDAGGEILKRGGGDVRDIGGFGHCDW